MLSVFSNRGLLQNRCGCALKCARTLCGPIETTKPRAQPNKQPKTSDHVEPRAEEPKAIGYVCHPSRLA